MSSQQCDNPSCVKAAAIAALKVCSRCKTEKYCSQECQAAAWPAHKTSCRRPNYIIKFHLAPGEITNPEVVRTLSCPADTDFYRLQVALQVAFDWSMTHSFDFAVKDPSYSTPDDIMDFIKRKMKVQQSGGKIPASEPREYLFRVVDPTEMSTITGIDRMHEGQRRHVNTPEKSASKYKLYQLLEAPQFQGHDIIYTYDFGDNWKHHLTVTGRADPSDDFVCLDGTGHGVAEDVGSYRGWEDLKNNYRTANPNAKQKESRSWFQNQASNRDPKGLSGDRASFWDHELVNKKLAKVYNWKTAA